MGNCGSDFVSGAGDGVVIEPGWLKLVAATEIEGSLEEAGGARMLVVVMLFEGGKTLAVPVSLN